ncbi:MAG TPA: SurA N-terminal domain-containing protein [Verrucomicrobiae bacterium]
MIGSIRKHSSWLWWIIAGLTIVSFVFFMGSGPSRNGGGPSTGKFGTIYGRIITAQDFQRAKAEFYLYYWMRSNGQWPDKTASVSQEEMEQGIYIRLLLEQKSHKLGIHVSEDALVAAASDFLRSLGRNGQPVAMDKFVEQVLAPEGLGVADLQNFLRDELVVQQMIQVLGLSGALVTPQEAGQLYDREHQEVSAQAVFFAASNYLAQVSVTPAAVAQFYTNYMAAYREPDRVQVSYVAYQLTNYYAAAVQKIGRTNLDAQVESAFRQHGMEAVPDAKTPEEAKAKIREFFIHQEALAAAKKEANDLATAVFALEPAKPENLTAYAKQKGLAVRTTAPFAANYRPEDFNAPAAFTKAAFQLSADEPFAGPVVGADGVYVLALANQLPSAIPALDQISARVSQDFQEREAVALAQRAGTNFYYHAAVQLAAGKTFAQAAVAGGQTPQILPAFSLSTQELPELGDRASLGQLKQAAFTTPAGHIGSFQPTSDGGFVLFVRQLLPVDAAKKNEELTQFIGQVRRTRSSEAFNLWLQGEANRELRDTPFFKKQAAASAAKQP